MISGIALAGAGILVFTNNRDPRVLAGSVVVAVLVALIGVVVVRYVPTERKNITKSLDMIVAAVVADDREKTLSLIAPHAGDVQALARINMARFRIEKASYSDLDIEINTMTSPPTAMLQFYAVVRVKHKPTGEGPFPARVRFAAEFEKAANGWVVSACDFKPHTGF
ncbi:MAG TPA: hypothetical protein DEB39_04580 [Planctomycetaceae bacterium]|nr:hypothetical protein [Planctomycetaceae bacterium]